MPRHRPVRRSMVGVLHGLIRVWLCTLCVFVLFCPAESTAQTAASYRKRATELSRAKSWDDAISNYRNALALEPNDAVTHYDLALALKYKGETREALKEFEAAVELRPKWADALNPNDAEAQYDLGRELRAGGDAAGAIAAFRRAIELKPDFEQAHYNLGLALRAQGDASSAKKELDEVSGLHEFRSRLAQS